MSASNPMAWIQSHKGAAAGIGVAGVAGLALYMRSRSSSSSASTSAGLGTSASASPGLTGAYGYDSSGIDTYNQLASAISDQNDQISSIQAELAGNAVGQIPPAAGSGLAAPTPGFGTIDTSQGEMVILGKEGATGYQGYDVSGGAPVFFGNATDLSQGITYKTPGSYVYTPVGYESLVSATQTHNG